MNRNEKSIKFLHVADIHLDISRYKEEERTEDFFFALRDVFEKYAVRENVKFVLVAGDLFDKKTVTPKGIDQAVECFQILKKANIPALVIEGNHDALGNNSNTSWLRTLSRWEQFILLEPEFQKNGKVVLAEWDKDQKKGAFIDIEDVRIYGNIWNGSVTGDNLIKIVDVLRDQHDNSKFNIMMLHTDIEGMINKNIKGLSLEKLRELKKYINYLALGHIHQNFVIDNWAHSPGSLECASINEIENVRGAYLVTITGKKFKAELKREYRQRPIQRLKFLIESDHLPEDFTTNFEKFLSKEIVPFDITSTNLAPIIEITFEGALGFKTSLLNLSDLREKIKNKYNSFLVLIKNQTIPVDIVSEVSDNLTRKEKEKQIIENLVSKDPRYSLKAESIADLVLEIKRMALSGEDPENIVNTIDFNN